MIIQFLLKCANDEECESKSERFFRVLEKEKEGDVFEISS